MSDNIAKVCQVGNEYSIWLQNFNFIIEDNILLCFINNGFDNFSWTEVGIGVLFRFVSVAIAGENIWWGNRQLTNSI